MQTPEEQNSGTESNDDRFTQLVARMRALADDLDNREAFPSGIYLEAMAYAQGTETGWQGAAEAIRDCLMSVIGASSAHGETTERKTQESTIQRSD